ncbi:MAG: hypothetical protein HYS13_23540 [Planctomycetia bacterium]|nr:hypothetical protein [Planctomycetia bacterium]
METVVHNVRDLNGAERSVAERLVGHALGEDQQLVIQVLGAEGKQADNGTGAEGASLPDWCNVYAGLTDQEIDKLERAISRRLDLTRPGV